MAGKTTKSLGGEGRGAGASGKRPPLLRERPHHLRCRGWSRSRRGGQAGSPVQELRAEGLAMAGHRGPDGLHVGLVGSSQRHLGSPDSPVPADHEQPLYRPRRHGPHPAPPTSPSPPAGAPPIPAASGRLVDGRGCRGGRTPAGACPARALHSCPAAAANSALQEGLSLAGSPFPWGKFILLAVLSYRACCWKGRAVPLMRASSRTCHSGVGAGGRRRREDQGGRN